MEALSDSTIKTLYKNIARESSSCGGYKDTICEMLNAQRQDGRYCDITLECNGTLFYSHKCVLAGTSEFFNVLFSTPLNEDFTLSAINLDNFSVRTVSLFLDIVYGEAAVENCSDVVELLRIAEHLQYQWLIDLLIKAIRTTIDSQNVFAWHEIAGQCGVGKLQVLTESFIAKSFGSCRRSVSNFQMDTLFSVVNDKQELHIVHPDCSSSEPSKYTGQMLQLFKDRAGTPESGVADKVKILDAFMHSKDLYVMTETVEFDCETFQYEGKSLALYRYEHLTETYHTVFSTDISDICRQCGLKREMVFQDVSYDSMDSLYFLMCDEDDEDEDQSVLLRYDLTKDKFFDNYVVLADDSYQDFTAYRKNGGVLIVMDLTCVYYVEYFNLMKPTDEQPVKQVSINSKTIFKKSVPNTSWFKVTLLDGVLYCFVKFGRNIWDRRNMVFHVLKFDKDSFCWDHLCDINFYAIFNCVAFQSKIYIYGLQDADKNPSKDNYAKFCKLCEFDPQDAVLVDSDMTLERAGFPDQFFTIPSYLLV